jgi:hypothetical protein
MSSRSAIKSFAATALLGVTLCGCSEYYFDRRDTVTLYSGDAVATNRMTQMIDPWPAASGQRNIAYNGERMQGAAERYRTHRVVQPVSAITSSTLQQQPPPALTTEAIPIAAGQSSQSAPASSPIK